MYLRFLYHSISAAVGAHRLACAAAGRAAALNPVEGASVSQIDSGFSCFTETISAAGGADLPSGSLTYGAGCMGVHGSHADGGKHNRTEDHRLAGCGLRSCRGRVRRTGCLCSLSQTLQAVSDSCGAAADAFVPGSRGCHPAFSVAPGADRLAAARAVRAGGGFRGREGRHSGRCDDRQCRETGSCKFLHLILHILHN